LLLELEIKDSSVCKKRQNHDLGIAGSASTAGWEILAHGVILLELEEDNSMPLPSHQKHTASLNL